MLINNHRHLCSFTLIRDSYKKLNPWTKLHQFTITAQNIEIKASHLKKMRALKTFTVLLIALASTATASPVLDSDLEKTCHSNADCPANACCSEWGYCGYGPEFCGKCHSDSECPSYAPCCSQFGYCGSTPEYCNSTPVPSKKTTPAPSNVSTPPRPLTCHSDVDCGIGECCSEWGYCGSGPDFCNSKCHSDSECPSYAPCCSEFGYCGSGPDYCQTTTNAPQNETLVKEDVKGNCETNADCPPEYPCCSLWGWCGKDSYCSNTPPTVKPITNTTTPGAPDESTTKHPKPPGPGTCSSDSDCPLSWAPCCSVWGYCGAGPGYCN